jgi:beta-glucosidase
MGIFQPLRPDNTDDVAMAEANNKREAGAWLDPLFKGVYGPETSAKIKDLREGDLAIINQKLDYLGVNYYFRNVVSKLEKIHPIEGHEYTAFDWEVYPPAFHDLLTRITQGYDRPAIYITENGAAYDDTVGGDGRVRDTHRINYYDKHIQEVARAIRDGADIRGYFAWSLLDNFEWAEGYSKRFGITYVDFPTQKRIVKDSGEWYAKLAAANEIKLSPRSAKSVAIASGNL